jgi:hypothetical protein
MHMRTRIVISPPPLKVKTQSRQGTNRSFSLRSDDEELDVLADGSGGMTLARRVVEQEHLAGSDPANVR